LRVASDVLDLLARDELLALADGHRVIVGTAA
jgi:hypothetical protein